MIDTRYVLVEWPESQMFMEYDWFRTEAILMNDEKHLETVGSSAYFIPEHRYDEAMYSDFLNRLEDAKSF